MDFAEFKKLRKKVENQTKKDMTALGVHKPEFKKVIERYAEMRVEYDILNEEWVESGCITAEEYTNKAGATNMRKTALYAAIEKLRADLTVLENILGLTPKGLKELKKKGLEQKKQSALDKLLSG